MGGSERSERRMLCRKPVGLYAEGVLAHSPGSRSVCGKDMGDTPSKDMGDSEPLLSAPDGLQQFVLGQLRDPQAADLLARVVHGYLVLPLLQPHRLPIQTRAH